MQMQTVDAAAKVARQLHKKNMGHRYIEIFEVISYTKTIIMMGPNKPAIHGQPLFQAY